MVEVFVKIFWQDNHGTEYCPFSHPDTIHLLTYAMILLNTDLHKATTKQKHVSDLLSDKFVVADAIVVEPDAPLC